LERNIRSGAVAQPKAKAPLPAAHSKCRPDDGSKIIERLGVEVISTTPDQPTQRDRFPEG
jgi:hypothetical protein